MEAHLYQAVGPQNPPYTYECIYSLIPFAARAQRIYKCRFRHCFGENTHNGIEAYLSEPSRSLFEYYFVQKTRVDDEVIKVILFQASRFLHTLHEFHCGLVVVETNRFQSGLHVRRHEPEYEKVFDAVLQAFSTGSGQNTDTADTLIARRALVNTRVANNLQHGRHGYGDVFSKVFLHTTEHLSLIHI